MNETEENKFIGGIAAFIAAILNLAIAWAGTLLIIYGACWGLDKPYSIKLATGVWCCILLVRLAIGGRKGD